MSNSAVGGPVPRTAYDGLRAAFLHERQGHLEATNTALNYAQSLLIAHYKLQLYNALVLQLCQTKPEAEAVAEVCRHMLVNLPVSNPAEQDARSEFLSEVSKLFP